jgi:hypothetical protein
MQIGRERKLAIGGSQYLLLRVGVSQARASRSFVAFPKILFGILNILSVFLYVPIYRLLMFSDKN